MRGADEQPGSMFSYVSLEERVPADHPLRAIRRITDRALERLAPRFGTLYMNFGPALDRAGEVAPRAASPGAVHDSQRAAADRAAGLQPAVPLVRGASGWTTRCGRPRRLRRIVTAWDEDRRWVAETAPPWRQTCHLDLYVRREHEERHAIRLGVSVSRWPVAVTTGRLRRRAGVMTLTNSAAC